MINTLLVIGLVAVVGIGAVAWRSPKTASAVKQAVKSTVSPNAVVAWEHGWKTSRITATRYSNKMMGMNIGFEFPKDPYECDRSELSNFIAAHGGNVYQGGGSPGASLYATFKGVTDIDTANKKLQDIMPAFNKLMQDIADGKKIEPIVNPDAKVWPDTDAPDKTNPYWEFNNNLNANGVQYKKAEVSPGKWQWIEDEKANQAMADEENHRATLWNALQTRVLTNAEMKEALGYGDRLNVQNMVSYYPEDKKRGLDRAYKIQDILRSEKAELTKRADRLLGRAPE